MYAYTMLKDIKNTSDGKEVFRLYNWGYPNYGMNWSMNSSTLDNPANATWLNSFANNGDNKAYAIRVTGGMVKTRAMFIRVPPGFHLHKAYLGKTIYNRNQDSLTISTQFYASDFSRAMTLRTITQSGITYYAPQDGSWVGDDGLLDGTAIMARDEYTITYHANGGSGSMSNTTKYYGVNTTLRSNTFTRTGYTFQGWSTSSTSSTVSYSNGATVTTNSSLNLYAVWKANTYTIDYNLTSGSWPHTSTSYHPDSASYDTVINIENPTRTGYTFAGWTFNGNTSYAKYGNSSSACTTSWLSTSTKVTSTYFKNLVTSDSVTLTANWIPRTYTVTLDTNASSGITSSGSTSVTATYNASMPSATMPTRAGYTFQGYYDTSAATGGIQYYTASGASARAWDKAFNATLCARWTPITYNISYVLNSGSHGTYHPASATYDTAFQLSNPSRSGYTFAGWTLGGVNYNTSTAQYGSSSSSCTTSWSSSSIKVTATYFKNLTTISGGTTTLTANWTARTYTVTLNPNGGTGGQTSVTATYDSAMPSITMPTRDGWSFLGYFDSQTGGTQYYTATGASARTWNKTTTNPTLYAHWQEKTWTEDYYASSYGGGDGTASNPYIISTAAHLARLSYATNNNIQTTSGRYDKNAYYKQTADIDINAHLWTPIGTFSNPFTGYYDGDFYKIKNIRIETTDDYVGLFGYAAKSIKNIYMQSGKVETTGDCAGAIAGLGYETFQNCIVEGITVKGNNQVGGLMGSGSYLVMKNCMVKNVMIEGNENVAGLVGRLGYYIDVYDSNVLEASVTSVANGGIIYGYKATSDYTPVVICYGNGTLNGTTTKVMYGDSSAWTNWSLVPDVNGGLPVQKGLYHIGGFTSSQEVYNSLTGQGYTVQ